MTLIIKELIIRGIVSNDHEHVNEASLDKESLRQYMEEMKKEITEECYGNLVQKLEALTER